MMAWTMALMMQSDPLAAEALRGWKHAWEGFESGSTVRVRQTTKKPGISPEGELAYSDETDEVTYVVVKNDGEKPVISIRSTYQSSEIPYYLTPPPWFRGKVEKTGTETIETAGKAWACDVYVFSLDEGKDASQRTTVWKAPGAPTWAVRMRVETFLGGRRNTMEEETLILVDQQVRIGDGTILCPVMESRTEVEGGPTTVKREWRSSEVPGRVARREIRVFDAKGKEIEAGAQQMEVVSYHAKR